MLGLWTERPGWQLLGVRPGVHQTILVDACSDTKLSWQRTWNMGLDFLMLVTLQSFHCKQLHFSNSAVSTSLTNFAKKCHWYNYFKPVMSMTLRCHKQLYIFWLKYVIETAESWLTLVRDASEFDFDLPLSRAKLNSNFFLSNSL